MTGTLLSYYLAFLFQTGQAAAPTAPAPAAQAPRAPAVAAIAPTARPAIKIVAEDRDADRKAPTANQSLGFDLATTTAGATKVATATSADEVVDAVQKFYKDIKQVTAKFRQEVTNPTFGRTTKSDGKVLIKKPGKMRWDYYGKQKKGKKVEVIKSFISNGTYLYVVDHSNKQVLEKNLEQNMLPVAVTFLYGKGDLKKDFDAAIDTSKKYGSDKTDIVLKLTPKQQTTQYKTLFLVVDKTEFRVKQSIIIDGAGAVNHFRFYEPDFDKALEEKFFKFDKKKVPNYRITKDDDTADAPKKDK
jgi:outer membrane lipoprotein carrier protein